MDKIALKNCTYTIINPTKIDNILGFTSTAELVIDPCKAFVRKLRPKLFHKIDSSNGNVTNGNANSNAASKSGVSTQTKIVTTNAEPMRDLVSYFNCYFSGANAVIFFIY
jgi:hypothetical protein